MPRHLQICALEACEPDNPENRSMTGRLTSRTISKGRDAWYPRIHVHGTTPPVWRSQVAREAATMQRAAAERERHVHLHAKREAGRAERDHHANAEVLDCRPVLLAPTH